MLADRMKELKPSATMVINTLAKQLKSEGKDVLIFAAGEPDFNTPDHVKKAAIHALEKNLTRYTAADGVLELRNAIKEKLRRENHIHYATEEIMASAGAKQALMNAFLALVQEGDEIIVPAPYWVSYLAQIGLTGATPVIVQTAEDFKLLASDIAAAITPRTKVILLNSPNNPTGAVIDREELEGIAKFAVAHNIYIISDEVYEHFIYDGKHVSIASLNEEIRKRTITINAVSKTYAMTGWRIGYAAGPAPVIKAMLALQSQMASNPTSIAQYAAVDALNGSQESVAMMKEAFRKRRDFVVEQLNAMPGITCQVPEGAFYAFFNVTGTGLDDMTFCKRLLEEQFVALVPGTEFGKPGFVRMSYAAADAELEKGMERMRTFCESLN